MCGFACFSASIRRIRLGIEADCRAGFRWLVYSLFDIGLKHRVHTYSIRVRSDERGLDIYGGMTTNSVKVQLYTGNGINAQQ